MGTLTCETKLFRDYPTSKIEAWLKSRNGRMPGRRAWKQFTKFARKTWGDFSAEECTRYGGISGTPKLLAAVSVIKRLRDKGERVPPTVGECLTLARERGYPLGFLPPVDHAVQMAKAAGRSDLVKDGVVREVDNV